MGPNHAFCSRIGREMAPCTLPIGPFKHFSVFGAFRYRDPSTCASLLSKIIDLQSRSARLMIVHAHLSFLPSSMRRICPVAFDTFRRSSRCYQSRSSLPLLCYSADALWHRGSGPAWQLLWRGGPSLLAICWLHSLLPNFKVLITRWSARHFIAKSRFVF